MIKIRKEWQGALGIVNSDYFYELSKDAQTLYFYLVINADETGFINNIRSIARAVTGNNENGEKAINELAKNLLGESFSRNGYFINLWGVVDGD